MILKFRWEGENLVLDRGHWDEWLARMDRPLPPPEEFTRDVLEREERRLTHPPVIALFLEEIVDKPQSKRREVANQLRALREQGQLSRDEYQRRRNSDPYTGGGSGFGTRSAQGGAVAHNAYIRKPKLFDASIRVDDTNVVFRFEENIIPYRSILVRESQGSLQISFVGESVLDVHQSAAGLVHLAHVVDDQIIQLNEDSFAALYEKHPDFVKERFLPLAEYLGLDVPPEGP